jgi:hypothetical protein
MQAELYEIKQRQQQNERYKISLCACQINIQLHIYVKLAREDNITCLHMLCVFVYKLASSAYQFELGKI